MVGMRPSAGSISPLVCIREVDPWRDRTLGGGICSVDEFEMADNGCNILKSSHTNYYAIDHKI